jgi:ribosomal protein S18 acetylase RimI-like enzyme
MFNYEPEGCFIMEVDGKPVGHVFSISYGKLGWIGLLIVKAEYRGKGIGTVLTKKAMNYLTDRGVETIKLEAVSTIANLYRKLGFVDEYDSLRFMGVKRKTTLPSSCHVRPLKKEELTKLAVFDAEYFGADRIKVLSRLYRDNPQLCFVSQVQSKIVGYIMCRKTKDGYKIGPWVCRPENPEVARQLLMRFLETVRNGEKLYVGVPALNREALRLLRDFNFKLYSKSVRMYFGKKFESERIDGIFAIGGPEKG